MDDVSGKGKVDRSSNLLDLNHNYQRKAAIAWGKGTDHAGKVFVKPLEQFSLNKTIFSTLQGKLARLLIHSKIAKADILPSPVFQPLHYQRTRIRRIYSVLFFLFVRAHSVPDPFLSNVI